MYEILRSHYKMILRVYTHIIDIDFPFNSVVVSLDPLDRFLLAIPAQTVNEHNMCAGSTVRKSKSFNIREEQRRRGDVITVLQYGIEKKKLNRRAMWSEIDSFGNQWLKQKVLLRIAEPDVPFVLPLIQFVVARPNKLISAQVFSSNIYLHHHTCACCENKNIIKQI